MEDDSTGVKEEDFDFSGAFMSSEKPAGPKSEKGRDILFCHTGKEGFWAIHGLINVVRTPQSNHKVYLFCSQEVQYIGQRKYFIKCQGLTFLKLMSQCVRNQATNFPLLE